MFKQWFRWALWLCWVAGANSALACAICAPSAAEQTLTQRLFKSEAVAMGQASAVAGQYRVVAAVRGNVASGLLDGVSVADGGAPPAPGTAVLLAQSGGTWRVMAPMPVERAAWVQQLIALRRAPDANPAEADWAARFAFFSPDLEHPVAAIAQVAYDELSSAPLGAMRAAVRSYMSMPLAKWLSQPELSERYPLYALMYGFVAPSGAAAFTQKRLLAQSARDSQATTSAYMAAVMELKGEDGLAWLIRHYLQDAARTDTEVQAALLAIRVMVADGRRIDRNAATHALAAYVQANPQRAGFAASDLGDWARWEFAEVFERLLDTDQPQVFASRYSMVLYLLRNPQPSAKASLERLRSKGRL